MTDKTPTLILFEHEDGRYGIAPEGQADFTSGDPAWHRLGPVEVVRLATPVSGIDLVEQIAQQWDGCEYDSAGEGLIDIGYAIRRAGFPLAQPVIAAPVEALYYGLTLDQVKERLAHLGWDELHGLVISLLIQKRLVEKYAAPTLAEPAQQDQRGATDPVDAFIFKWVCAEDERNTENFAQAKAEFLIATAPQAPSVQQAEPSHEDVEYWLKHGDPVPANVDYKALYEEAKALADSEGTRAVNYLRRARKAEAALSQPVIAAPVEALSEERLYDLADSEEANPDKGGWGPKFDFLAFARLIERAHGIGAAPTLAEPAQLDQWKQAIDDELATLLSTADSYPSAKEAVKALIDWHVSVALDPAVSSAAQALIDKGMALAAAPAGQAVGDALEACRLFVEYDDDDHMDGYTSMQAYAAALQAARKALASSQAEPPAVQQAAATEPKALDSKQFYSVVRSAMREYRSRNPSRYLNDDQASADDAEFVSGLADCHVAVLAAEKGETK